MSVTSTGLGTSSWEAPVATSTPNPMGPPTRTLPATPAARPPAVRWVTFTRAVSQPGLEMVATNSERRGILMAHGVEPQL